MRATGVAYSMTEEHVVNDQQPAQPDWVPPGQAQPVPAGQSAPVPPQAGAPSPQRRARVRLLIGGILGGVFALLTAVVLLVVFVVVPHVFSSPTWLAEKAIKRLEAAQTVHYRGSFVDTLGRSVELDAEANADYQAAGRLRLDGKSAEFFQGPSGSVRGTFVKAGAAFWESASPDDAGVAAGRWTDAEPSILGLPIDPYLRPDKLGETLRKKLLGADRSALKKGPERKINGVRAVRLSAGPSGGAYVSLGSSPRVVHVDGPLAVRGRLAEAHNYDFDVDELSGDAAVALRKRMAGLEGTAKGAINPNTGQNAPPRFEVDDILEIQDKDCSDVSCRMVVVVRNVNGPAQPGARAKVVGFFTLGKQTGGQLIGRCESAVPAIAKDQTAKVSCVVGDSLWANFNRRQFSTFWYTYRAFVFNPGWDGTDIAAFKRQLERNTDMDAAFTATEAGGPLGLRTYARLLGYPGIKPGDAADLVNQATQVGQLDVLHTYAASGRLADPKGLKAFLDKAYLERNDHPTLVTLVWQLRVAAQRAANGSGRVTLGSWSPPGVKSPTVKADVVDTGRKEAVQCRIVAAHEASKAVEQITKAATELRAKPAAGYKNIVELRIENVTNPLAALKGGALRDALKKAGLDAGGLGGVTTLVIANKHGKQTFAATDFG